MIGEITSYYRYSKNLQLDHRELRSYQDKKIRILINHAYRNVPYYKEKLDSLGLNPSDINNVDDLRKIPIITKAEIQAGQFEDHLATNFSEGMYRIRETSGSTGKPLKIYIDSDAIRISESIWLRAFFRNGLRIRDKIAYIGNPRHQPTSPRFIQKLGIMPRRNISIFDKPDDQLRALNKYKPDVIRCWTSCLSVLAYKKDSTYDIHPRMIFTSAELLEDSARRYLESSFGAELFDYYACEELGLIGWECREHNGYHINTDSIIVEILRDGEEVAPGERGEITCTHLDNFAMPLIRYKLGDIGVKGASECTCDVAFPKILSIEGRNDDFLVTPNGELISPRTISDVLEYSTNGYRNILQYQIHQLSKNDLRVRLVTNNEFSTEETISNHITTEMKKYFGESVNVHVEFVYNIPSDPSGKINKVISNIKISLHE